MGQAPTRAEVDVRAERGAALLDQHDPNWAILLRTDGIIMEYPDTCVLGRVFDLYLTGVRTLGLPEPSETGMTIDHPVVQNGFDLCDDDITNTITGDVEYTRYRVLTDAWRHQIYLRHVRGVVPVPVTS